MLYRRKVLLHLLEETKAPISLVKLHKLMFLLMRETQKKYYSFIPNNFGCYSFTLHDDQIALQNKGLINILKGKTPFNSYISLVTPVDDKKNLIIDRIDEHLMKIILNDYLQKTDMELVDITYHSKPFYSLNSQIISRFSSDEGFNIELSKIQKRIKNSPRGLYTIGYEGKSIDSFLQHLILRNIKTLIDVRKNPLSRRREFCKNNLIVALKEVGIEYVSLKEVGIPSTNRKDLLPQGKRAELFSWYRETILPDCFLSAERVANIIGENNAVLMCYEHEPTECHRTIFANYCFENFDKIPQIIPIG